MTDGKGKQALVPKLRFPEFVGKAIHEVVRLSSVSSPVTNSASPGAGEVVLTLSGEHGLISQASYFGKRVAGTNVERYTSIKFGDFVYNDRITSDSPLGTIKRLHSEQKGLVSPIYKCFRFSVEQCIEYWDYHFESGNQDSELRSLVNEGARSGRFNISITQFLSTHVPVLSRVEQQKIAACLQSLDELIALETRKLGALKQYKKSLLQQLFPVEGENIPRLRFSEFREEWSYMTVESIIKNVSSGKSQNEVFGASQLYGSTGVIGTTDNAPYSGEYILIARVGANAGFLTYIDSKRFGATDNTLVLSAGIKACTKFLFFYLSKLDLNRMVFGSGQPLITGSQLKDLIVSIPTLNEQKKIAAVATGVDLVVVETESGLLRLRSHKDGLMQQLFPTLDDLDS